MRGELAALEAEGEQAARRLQSLTAEAATLEAAGERRENERAEMEAAGPDAAVRPDEAAPAERRAAQARLVGEAAVRLSVLEGEEGALREALRGREAALAWLRQQGQARRAQLERGRGGACGTGRDAGAAAAGVGGGARRPCRRCRGGRGGRDAGAAGGAGKGPAGGGGGRATVADRGRSGPWSWRRRPTRRRRAPAPGCASRCGATSSPLTPRAGS